MNFLSKLRTYLALGIINIARVAAYRVGLKTGLHPVLRIVARVPTPPFFLLKERKNEVHLANMTWRGSLCWFGWYYKPWCDNIPPNWLENPFSETEQPDAKSDWWSIPDFKTGDIKGLWELSRFDWVIPLATRAAANNLASLERLNFWIEDWSNQNPPYRGPNWKCGQEASIRVIHLVTAAWILDQDKKPTRVSRALVPAFAAYFSNYILCDWSAK